MSEVIITPTVYAQALAAAKKVGGVHLVPPYTTINEQLRQSQINPNIPNPATAGLEVTDEYDPETDTAGMLMRYLVLGNRGHYTWYGDTPDDGVPSAVEHASNDSGLYRPIPFLSRPIESDLTPSQRQRYRLRVPLTIDGSLRAFYFGRVLDLTTATPDMIIYRLENSQVVDQAVFTPSIDNLLPQHPTGDLTNDKTHIAVTIPYAINFTTTEINEIVDACTLLYGDARRAYISEIAICHAVDKTVTHRYPVSGQQTATAIPEGTYFEAVAMQVDTHVTLTQSLSQNQVGFGISMQVGGGRPLYPTSSTSSSS